MRTAASCCRSRTTASASISRRPRADTACTTCASGRSPSAARSVWKASPARAREYAWSCRRWRRGMAEPQVRVMLVDDHEVVREGLRTLIGRQKDMVVVGEAGTTAEAIETAAKAKPDVIIMDVRLPDGSGVEACRTIREAR